MQIAIIIVTIVHAGKSIIIFMIQQACLLTHSSRRANSDTLTCMSEAPPSATHAGGHKNQPASVEPTLNLQIRHVSKQAVETARASLDGSLVTRDGTAFRKAMRLFMSVLADPEVNDETRRWLVIRGAELEQDPAHNVRGIARELCQRLGDQSNPQPPV